MLICLASVLGALVLALVAIRFLVTPEGKTVFEESPVNENSERSEAQLIGKETLGDLASR